MMMMMMMMMHLAVHIVGKQVVDQILAVPDRSPLAPVRNLIHDNDDNGNCHVYNDKKVLEPSRNQTKSSSLFIVTKIMTMMIMVTFI